MAIFGGLVCITAFPTPGLIGLGMSQDRDPSSCVVSFRTPKTLSWGVQVILRQSRRYRNPKLKPFNSPSKRVAAEHLCAQQQGEAILRACGESEPPNQPLPGWLSHGNRRGCWVLCPKGDYSVSLGDVGTDQKVLSHRMTTGENH